SAQPRPAQPAQRVFHYQTTAPAKLVEIGQEPLRPEQELVLGRAQNNRPRINEPSVSSRHASVRVEADGEVVVRDLGSTNGTTIRKADGTIKITLRSEEALLEPGDRLFLSDHEVPLGEKLESRFSTRAGDRKVDLRSGETPIGDGRWGVGPRD